jgi:hypothetical protein
VNGYVIRTLRGNQRTRGRRLRSVLTAVLALVAAGLASVAGVLPVVPAAGLAGSSFESTDGNLIVDSTRDWANIGIDCGEGSDNCKLDKPTGATDDSLGQGSKDDDQTPTVVTGSIPNNKSDLTRFYVESETIGKDVFLYLATERANTLGTANYSIELNQLAQPDPPAAGGSWTLERTAGDVLILFDFTSGGNVEKVELGLAKWVTTGNPKTVCQASNRVPCWSNLLDLDKAGFADGAINTTEVVDPIPPNAPRTLAPITFGEAAVNLTKAGVLNACIGFGSAMVRSRASAAFNAELKDFIAPLDTAILPPADISGAAANGSATAARVSDPTLGLNQEINTVATAQQGSAGTEEKTDHGDQVNVPDPSGEDLHVGTLHVTSNSTITQSPAEAKQMSAATTADVNVMHGVVTADVVRGVADASANPLGATYSSLGSSFKNLKVDTDGELGPAPPIELGNNVAPNTTVTLSPLFFGEGSFVKLYDESGSVPTPPDGAKIGDQFTYTAEVTVRMIWVHVTDRDPITPNNQGPVDVVVSEATAHAEFKATLCNLQEVSGHAFILQEETDPPLAPVTLGFVQIPRLGGHAHQEMEAFSSPAASLGASESDSQGTVVGNPRDPTAGSSTADSYAQAAGVCLLPGPSGCTVEASLVRSEAHSSATAAARSSNATGTQLLGVQVAGTPQAVNPAPNTRVDLPGGLGFVILNEQRCGDGRLISGPTCGADANGKTAITVRAIHLVLLPNEQGGELAEIIVAEAESDAKFPVS